MIRESQSDDLVIWLNNHKSENLGTLKDFDYCGRPDRSICVINYNFERNPMQLRRRAFLVASALQS